MTTRDENYCQLSTEIIERPHQYGENIHLVDSIMAQSLLAKASTHDISLMELNSVVKKLFELLLSNAIQVLGEREVRDIKTRMADLVKEGMTPMEVLANDSKSVSVSMARAGILASQTCFEWLSLLMNPENVRQDHFYLQRKMNEKEEVIGVDATGSKIGGDIDNALVFFPDPMGATGSSLCHAIDHYKAQIEGSPRKYVALHLIITPEFIEEVGKRHPDVEIFALRLDRGLSDPSVFCKLPGEDKALEKGLTEKSYIVPGAGGMGEVLNNSFV